MDTKEMMGQLWRVLVWLFKATMIVLALGITVALLGVLVEFQRNTSDSEIPVAATNAWLMVLGLVLLVLIVIVALRGVRCLFVSSPGPWSLFGSTAATRLVALGVVSLVFPRAVYSLITAPVTVLVQVLAEIPQDILRYGRIEGLEITSLEQTFARLLWILSGIGTEFSKGLTRLLGLIPVSDVVIALALWVILGQLFGEAAQNPGGAKQIRLFSFLQGLSDKQKRNIWLGIVFFFGIYLSIAAIVAIPMLQEDKSPQTVTRERLEKALQLLIPKMEDVEPTAAPSTSAAVDPLVRLEEVLNETAKKTESTKPDPNTKIVLSPSYRPMDVIVDIRRLIADARAARVFVRDQRDRLREQANQQRTQILGEALSAFDSETLSPMSTQERAFFFRDIQRSVQYQVSELQQALQDCRRTVLDVENQIEAVSRDLTSALSRTDITNQIFPGVISGRVFAGRACGSSLSAGPQKYAAPDPGAGWGPFAIVAQWLLRTKSLALALITGMLGFGLLGSAIATFVRPTPTTPNTAAVLGEVATIIVRGLSAAIVVFLSVKGGLAILSSGEAEPNAYVLFFTCLVGAVFSEDVWQWARNKFGEQFSQGGGAGQTSTAVNQGQPASNGAASDQPGSNQTETAAPPSSPGATAP